MYMEHHGLATNRAYSFMDQDEEFCKQFSFCIINEYLLLLLYPPQRS